MPREGLGHPIGTLDDNARLALTLIPGGIAGRAARWLLQRPSYIAGKPTLPGNKPPSPPKATAEPATPPTTAVPRNRLPTQRSQLMHIFRNKKGHLPDTPANRQLLKDVANDPTAVLGMDTLGTVWSSRILSDGRQVWARARDGTIINGGINDTPHTYNPRTGLSSPQRRK